MFLQCIEKVEDIILTIVVFRQLTLFGLGSLGLGIAQIIRTVKCHRVECTHVIETCVYGVVVVYKPIFVQLICSASLCADHLTMHVCHIPNATNLNAHPIA